MISTRSRTVVAVPRLCAATRRFVLTPAMTMTQNCIKALIKYHLDSGQHYDDVNYWDQMPKVLALLSLLLLS